MSDLSQFWDKQLKDPLFREYYIEMMPAKDISKAILAGRFAKRLTQTDLAVLSGVSQADISRYENFDKLPDIKTLQKIAKALGCGVKIEFVSLPDVESTEWERW